MGVASHRRRCSAAIGLDAGAGDASPAAVAQRLEGDLETAWRRQGRALANRAIQATRAAGLGAIGWAGVLGALLQGRVEHLVSAADVSTASAHLPAHALGALRHRSGDLLVERAVEQAVASDADVTVLAEEDADALWAAGGITAGLRS